MKKRKLKMRTGMVDISKIECSHEQYGVLTRDQQARIASFVRRLYDYHPSDLDQSFREFGADLEREREIRLWEAIADTHEFLTERHRLSQGKREHLFKALLALTLGKEHPVHGLSAGRVASLPCLLRKSWSGSRDFAMNADPVTYSDLTDEQRREVFAYREKQEAHRRMLVPVAWILGIAFVASLIYSTKPANYNGMFTFLAFLGGYFLKASEKNA